MTSETTILVVDDHPLLRKGLRTLIDEEEGFRVVGEANDGRRAIEKVRQLRPNLVIMDINMPHLDGIEATRQILSEAPQTRVLALSIHAGERYVEKMLEAGASGYLLKESAPKELIEALHALQEGKGYLSVDITNVVLSKLREPSSPEQEGKFRAKEELEKEKLARPPLPEGMVHRRTLVERLERGRKKKLTLVVAPSGYGKSTLVCDWLSRCDHPNVWVSLGTEDNDLGRFLSLWIAAIDKLFPNASAYARPLVEATDLPPIPILAGALVADLEGLPEAFFLVLDNMQEIKEKSIYDLLSMALRQSFGEMHLVLIGRHDPFLPIKALRVGNMLNEIRTDSLKFLEQETRNFLEKSLGRSIDSKLVSEWHERSQGWVAGLQLAIHSLGEQDQEDPRTSHREETSDWRSILTNRELELLLLLRERLRDKEIADQLHIAPGTVRTHLKNLYSKLQATGRRDAVVKAEQLGLLD